jgi:hypothetical protein
LITQRRATEAVFEDRALTCDSLTKARRVESWVKDLEVSPGCSNEVACRSAVYGAEPGTAERAMWWVVSARMAGA